MSETHITGFNSDFVVLQSAGDPAVSPTEVKTVQAVTDVSGIARLTVTGHGYSSGNKIVVSNLGSMSGTREIIIFDADKFDLVGVSYSSSFMLSESRVSNNINFFDSSRRPDVAEMERCRFAGVDDSPTAQGWVMGPNGGSTSFTDTTFAFCKHFVRMYNIIAITAAAFPNPEVLVENPDSSGAPGFLWIAGKGGEGNYSLVSGCSMAIISVWQGVILEHLRKYSRVQPIVCG